MKNENELNVNIKILHDGSHYITAHVCASCNHIQKVKSFTSFDKFTFIANSECDICRGSITTCYGDRLIIDSFLSSLNEYTAGLEF